MVRPLPERGVASRGFTKPHGGTTLRVERDAGRTGDKRERQYEHIKKSTAEQRLQPGPGQLYNEANSGTSEAAS
jgi:hypothetical protein